ncbi:glycosyltransferase [Desulfovibrio sp. JC010]|uniref:glycosyltransferase n=1 Tax=Desulfovibrio sp. JC010 TaxID=2593641 RepID=UPI0013D86C40|nr:glycosyltransferase [Desulfovibrio sp. JC010]NDV28432.1 glycosyltransferase family 2 protein [Desulfovibrio sp. JC010]
MGKFYSETYWADMHEPVRRKLLMGSAGAGHLFNVGAIALESDPQLGVELLLAAYVSNPLDGNIAVQLAQVEGLLPLFPTAVASCLKAVSAGFNKPDNLSYFMRLAARRDDAKIRNYILSCLEKEPGNLFWVQQGLVHAGAFADFSFGLDILSGEFTAEIFPAINSAKAFFHYMNGDAAEALPLLMSSSDVFGLNNMAHLAASITLKLGERETAVSILSGAVDGQPWRVSEALRLHDLACGLDDKNVPLPGSLAVLLYSFNKAAELDATLASLNDSELHGVKIFMLDNGSSDGTAEVITKWQPEFGEQMMRIDLPVNVGAAAARNWLMKEPLVQECDFAVYLDDDVEVSPDWISRLGAAVEAYPEAGVWGCKVLDHAAPAVMQSVDLHLIQPAGDEGEGPEVDLAKIAPNPFRCSDLHLSLLDGGYFDFMRPCGSVTGCCHLFRTQKLLDNGGFSLFLSPSQYDDLEHDLRSCLKGEFPVYQGHLSILHRKRSGFASHTSAAQEGNALGNRYKMQAMHPRSEILQIMADEERLLQSDLEKKMQYLVQKGILAG